MSQETLLREILAELKGLREDLAASRLPGVQTSLTRADRALLARLLPAAGGAIGSVPFLVRELFEDDSAALHLVLRGLNAKGIGRLLRRAAGQAIDGYLVEEVGAELNTTLWRVVQAPGFLGNENPAVPPRDPKSLAK